MSLSAVAIGDEEKKKKKNEREKINKTRGSARRKRDSFLLGAFTTAIPSRPTASACASSTSGAANESDARLFSQADRGRDAAT